MSRSRKKTPIFGNTTASSEKKDKQKWNKRFRRTAKILMQNQQEIPIKKQAVSDVWEGNKDGKQYFVGVKKKDMRK